MAEETPSTPPDAAAYREILDIAADPGPPAAASVRLSRAVRRLNDLVVGSQASADVLERVAEGVERLADVLAPHSSASRFGPGPPVFGPRMNVNHPMIGAANPSAPPIRMHPDGEALVGDVVFGTRLEGPPGCAYGGYIAAGFDAILLMTAALNGVAGPTRSLEVRYRRPTPINTPLRYRGAIEWSDERTTRVTGRLLDGETVYADGVAEVASARVIRLDVTERTGE
jgi:hypothetical protein